jgi:biopolymer transport protein TolQ
MATDPALTAESFSALNRFLRADWVVKSVMIGLAAASLWSWTIMIDKFFRLAALNRAADQFEDEVGSGRSLEDVAASHGEQPRQPLPRMLAVALREWREMRSRGPVGETAGAMMMQRIDRGLDGVIARESQRVENGLGSLAIVATSSPFIGLFGTVWGIMHAFQEIAVQRSTNLTVVAPAIAEALFATAVGLIAAIPAYIAYNKFSTDAARFSARLESFADDLTATMARRLAGPAQPAARGAA